MPAQSEGLVVGGCHDHAGIDGVLVLLHGDHHGVGHDVVNDARVMLRHAVEGGHGRLVNDLFRAAGTADLMPDILRDFLVGKPLELVVDSDPLAQGLVDRLAQRAVQVRLPAEDQGEAVEGVVFVVHEHLEVVEDGCIEVLCLIDHQDEGSPLFFIQVPDLFLDRLEHARLPAPCRDAEEVAELLVEFRDADGGEADVGHVVQVFVQALREGADDEGLAIPGRGSEDADPPCFHQMPEGTGHFFKVARLEAVLCGRALLRKGVVSEPEEGGGRDHEASPPISEYRMAGGLFRFVRQFSFLSVLRIGKWLPSQRINAVSMSLGTKRISTFIPMNCMGAS